MKITLDEVVQFVMQADEEYGNALASGLNSLRDEVNGLTGSLDRAEAILRLAECGSVDSFLALPDIEKRIWFAVSVEESSRRKEAEEALQNLMSFLSVNGTDEPVSADEAEKRIHNGIDMLVRPAVERAERAESQLKEAREQEPLMWETSSELMDILKDPIYASPVPAAVAMPDMTDDALKEMLNAAQIVGCDDPIIVIRGFAMRVLQEWGSQEGMYKAMLDAVAVKPALAVPAEWREVMAELAADLQAACDAEHPHRDQYPSIMRKYRNDMEIVEKARALLQSTGEKK